MKTQIKIIYHIFHIQIYCDNNIINNIITNIDI